MIFDSPDFRPKIPRLYHDQLPEAEAGPQRVAPAQENGTPPTTNQLDGVEEMFAGEAVEEVEENVVAQRQRAQTEAESGGRGGEAAEQSGKHFRVRIRKG